MKTNYVLIDLENVQPKNLELLKGHGFKVIVFVGSKQVKIFFDLACAMQSLGSDAEYVKIEGSGPNALDFHIAFYIGNIAAKDSDCYFHIISKDTGFDPLIKHLKTKRIYAQREKDISEIPLLKISNSKSMVERIDAIVEFLKARGAAKPRAVKTLSNSINSLFMKKLEEDELAKIMDELIRQKIVIANGSKVSYQLPDKP
ncbi:PIN domain-containing protein [Microbulbifer thermotolerans]|uniref:PIN domain-containing protein n=1 Tax=Microbulbifer thermotolerans TaxID=252514 RepID=A0AB35HVC1_MICTH|nr:PIN domain-containing protein [Microbulbifer thermotolerans]MCX2793607.1 PIN domain-containing protein [Microbulbifer thermotolerans]MCX2801523.1 PIN domain-containing protein [Microbulbifer thermotolerans]WKT61466.1 PIN domain-containing protein [Microbulbifer thermotolerans]